MSSLPDFHIRIRHSQPNTRVHWVRRRKGDVNLYSPSMQLECMSNCFRGHALEVQARLEACKDANAAAVIIVAYKSDHIVEVFNPTATNRQQLFE